MNRKTKVTAAVLSLFIAFSVSGCSEQYKIERMVWNAEKTAEPIFVNQAMVSAFEFRRAISKFQRIVEISPGTEYGINAQLRIGELYTIRELYDDARAMYDEIISSYKDKPELVALAVFKKGQAYEKEGNWPKAVEAFDLIMKDFEKTSQSLSTPLYIARYYAQKGEKKEAQQAYSKAADYYQSLADKYKNTRAALLAENLIVRTYMEEEDWSSAVGYINRLDKKYKLGPDTLLVLAKIYQNKLNNISMAKSIYERILNTYSDKEQIVKSVTRELDALENSAGKK